MQIQVVVFNAYFVWAQEAAYSHTELHHTARIKWSQEFAYSYTVSHHTAHSEWAQEFAYSHTVIHHTARIKWSQEFAYSHAGFQHTAYIVLSTSDSVATQGCRFQKDCDEQARCEFTSIISWKSRILISIRFRASVPMFEGS